MVNGNTLGTSALSTGIGTKRLFTLTRSHDEHRHLEFLVNLKV